MNMWNEPNYVHIDDTIDDIQSMDKRYIAPTYGRAPICFVKGIGSYVYGTDGKEYIDLGSGIGVTSFGIADPVWEEAVVNQVKALNHVSNLYYTAPQAMLAKALCEKTGMSSVFFSNSGAEANECAIKGARKYSFDKYGDGRGTIITLENSFHGRTITTLSATGQDVFHQYFGPFTEGFVHTPANDIEALYALAERQDICAIMMEMIQGEGGVMPLQPEFVKAATTLAAEKDWLVIVDEVQTGNGRTGTMYAYEQFHIQPHIVSTAKGLAGGLPMGATLFNETVASVWGVGDHGSTFGGNPICAAGALTVVNRIDSELLQEVQEKGRFIKDSLIGAPGVISVDGLGLMVGIGITGDAKKVQQACLEQGVIVLTAKDKIRLLPALTIPMEALQKGLEIVKGAVTECGFTAF